MKASIICLLSLFILSMQASAQLEERIAKWDVVSGAIIMNGEKQEGYIMSLHSIGEDEKVYSRPWVFQDHIRFIDKKVFENAKKVKLKMFTKYKPKDINGYIYGDLYTYVSVKYADMSAIGTGMIAKRMFMRKVTDGPISIFHHFDEPPAVNSPNDTNQYGVANLVYQKGEDGKLKLVNDLNVKKELADCPLIVEKHEKGIYLSTKDDEGSKLSKLAVNTTLRKEARLMVIEDYNNNCQ